MEQIRYGVLGSMMAWRDGRVLALGPAKQQTVLAVLLLEMNRPVPVTAIIDAVWGEQPPNEARNVVQSYVSRLRRALRFGPAAGESDPGLGWTDAGYVLRGDTAAVDLVVFEQHLAQAEDCRRRGDLAAATEQIDAALDLWRGEPFSGLEGRLIETERRRLQERHLAALELRAAITLDRGLHSDAVAELTHLVAAHPLQERLRGLLMVALYRCGRQADALAVFLETRHQLAEELGIEPGPELCRLHQRILAGDPELAVPPQVKPPTGRNDLPGDIADYTGRDEEMQQLYAVLPREGDGATAVIIEAIDGMAGVGKTVLAVHAAHQLTERYPDAQLFIDLQGHSEDHRGIEPMMALDILLRALDVPGTKIPQTLAERAALWRAELAQRRVLVVLDNAADAAQVRPLLPGNAGCLALITSRRRMVALDAAQILSLEVLDHGEAVTLFSRILGDDRATTDPAATADLMERCGYLPLAIRIAAGRLRSRPAWTVAHLAMRLSEGQRRLDELAIGDRGVAGAFALSYEHLTPDQQRLFRLLGLHPGPDFDTYLVAALADIGLVEADRLLEELVDIHLIQQPAPGRYRFHDLLHRYAVQLSAGSDTAADRHAALTRALDYYVHTASRAMDIVVPYDKSLRPDISVAATPTPTLSDCGQAGAWLETERLNLLAAVRHAADHGWSAHAGQLSAILMRYLDLRGHNDDALVVHAHVVAAAHDRTSGRAVECVAQTGHALALLRASRFEEALAHGLQALSLARAIGNREIEGYLLQGRAVVEWRLGRLKEALAHGLQALSLARAIGNREIESYALHSIGLVHERTGRFTEAFIYFQRALDLARDHGNREIEYQALHGTGVVYRRLGRNAEALNYAQQSLNVARATGSRAAECQALHDVGSACRRMGRFDEAFAHFRKSLTLARDTGDRALECQALLGLGETAYSTNDQRQAQDHLRQTLALASEIGERYHQARAHDNLAHTLLDTDPHTAHTHWLQSLDLYTDLGAPEANDVAHHLASIDRPQ
ncbi:tetratricopeptide repeat protein [Nocardia sp. CDC159]|uniref:Tetratricopeptide repeat protein n=1 Tax=Nocardia pulmonis TaxID=2951408 RepID=A0A9X2E7D2_9NOCA|nr:MULTISPECIES: AfsR/SARP family transcriptional regulator [Nocardia]MCM6774543.1 tetratricopeptide repeat protein [Nocardia pulmonis]MCM6787391.1 tetratricopeptide repeat protein [Nocardia sp. CDC159]